jgi:hypothetical protein
VYYVAHVVSSIGARLGLFRSNFSGLKRARANRIYTSHIPVHTIVLQRRTRHAAFTYMTLEQIVPPSSLTQKLTMVALL